VQVSRANRDNSLKNFVISRGTLTPEHEGKPGKDVSQEKTPNKKKKKNGEEKTINKKDNRAQKKKKKKKKRARKDHRL